MYARAVDDAVARLRELRRQGWEDLALGGLALALAIAATQVRPELAVPFLLGGLAVGGLGIRALWRRWDLVERLAGERDAYLIPEVLACASREATIERRRSFAALIRLCVEERSEARVAPLLDELEALASELEDEERSLDRACAVACMGLLTGPEDSPLLNPSLPPEELRSRIRQIRSGFEPR